MGDSEKAQRKKRGDALSADKRAAGLEELAWSRAVVSPAARRIVAEARSRKLGLDHDESRLRDAGFIPIKGKDGLHVVPSSCHHGPVRVLDDINLVDSDGAVLFQLMLELRHDLTLEARLVDRREDPPRVLAEGARLRGLGGIVPSPLIAVDLASHPEDLIAILGWRIEHLQELLEENAGVAPEPTPEVFRGDRLAFQALMKEEEITRRMGKKPRPSTVAKALGKPDRSTRDALDRARERFSPAPPVRTEADLKADEQRELADLIDQQAKDQQTGHIRFGVHSFREDRNADQNVIDGGEDPDG